MVVTSGQYRGLNMSANLRIFLSGQKAFGSAMLDTLLGMGHVEVVGVSCPINPLDKLFKTARYRELPIIASGTLQAESLPANVDLIVCAHSHDFIGRRTRLTTRLGAIGYHPSLLPLHRGRDAVYWTIRFGDKVTGGSVYWLSDTVDGGDIAAQDWCFVRLGDTAKTLWRRELFQIGLRLIQQVVENIQKGIVVAIPQDTSLVTWEPSLEREPLQRKDMPLLGNLSGYTVIREKSVENSLNFGVIKK